MALFLSAAARAEIATSATMTMTFPTVGTAPVTEYDEIEKMTKQHGSELLVVNFWATWCGPCVEELPYFTDLANEYDPSKVRVLAISVDRPNTAESSVLPFLKKHELPFSTPIFNGNPERMINYFDPEWGGDVPATFIYDKQGKQIAKFVRPVERAELFEKAKELLSE